MKIVGLMIVKNEADILWETLDHAAGWLDGIVAIDNGSSDDTRDILLSHPLVLEWGHDPGEFNEARMVPELINLAAKQNADWYVDHDSDEFFPKEIRKDIEVAHKYPFNVVSVDILSQLNGRTYNIKHAWRRIYRNDPTLFDFSEIKQLHHGKIPIRRQDKIQLNTSLKVIHKSVRSFEQGMRKYENYKRIDTGGIQKSYEHIRVLAEALKNNDFSGVTWVS